VAKWWRRYREEGDAGLRDRTSRARSIRHALSEEVVEAIVRLRRELEVMHAFPSQYEKQIHDFFFYPRASYEYSAFDRYCEGYPDWAEPRNMGKINELKSDDGWHWIQGNSVAKGQLVGGCLETLEQLKTSDYWPELSFWKNKVLSRNRKQHLLVNAHG
jgi:hypothetical protein